MNSKTAKLLNKYAKSVAVKVSKVKNITEDLSVKQIINTIRRDVKDMWTNSNSKERSLLRNKVRLELFKLNKEG